MPAGLDGNPDPIRSPKRRAVLDAVTERVLAARVPGRPTLVAIDGIDGAGKSTFASELEPALGGAGVTVVRSTIDWFHRPRAERWAKGKTSPVGFYHDSHDLDAVRERLLEPFRTGAGSRYRIAAFDEPGDRPLDPEPCVVAGDEVLVFDGIFALRPELAPYWDFSIFLDGAERVGLTRLGYVMDDCPIDRDDVVAHVLDWVGRIDRYSSGMRYYLDSVDPGSRADLVVDNNDLNKPRIVVP